MHNAVLAGVAIALCVITGTIVKQRKARYALVSAVPLVWLTVVTSVAAWQKIFSTDVRLGLLAAANDFATKLAAGTLPPKQALVAPQLIFNQKLDAVLTAFLTLVMWIIVLDTARVCWRVLKGLSVLPSSESRYVAARAG